MNPSDFERTMLTLLHRKPFRPFTIELNEGEPLMVVKPESLFYHAGSTGMYSGPDGSLHFVDSENVKQFLDLVPQPVG